MPNPETLTRLALPDAADWLKRAYEVRKLNNPSYSQRAFAKHLGLSSGRLSEIFSKRRLITENQIEKFSRHLHLSTDELRVLKSKVKEQRQAKRHAKTTRALLTGDSAGTEYTVVSEDCFATFADWYHLAILNLMKIKGFKSDLSWVADRLGLTEKEVSEAVARLERLGLIRRTSKRWTRTVANLRTTSDVPSAAIRIHHRQQLNLALRALETVPVELRDISSMTLAVDLAQLKKAKEMIKNFRRTLADFLGKENQTEVYHLTISLSPLSQNLPKKESIL